MRSWDLWSSAGTHVHEHVYVHEHACVRATYVCVCVVLCSCPPGAWLIDQSARSPQLRGARPSFRAPIHPTLPHFWNSTLPRYGRLTCALRSRPGENLSALLYAPLTLLEKNRSALRSGENIFRYTQQAHPSLLPPFQYLSLSLLSAFKLNKSYSSYV